MLKRNYSTIILIKKSESKRISFKCVYFEAVSVANRLDKKGSNICRQPVADFFSYLISLKNVFFVDSKRQLSISKTSIALVLLLLLWFDCKTEMEKNLQIQDAINYHWVKIGNSALFSKIIPWHRVFGWFSCEK